MKSTQIELELNSLTLRLDELTTMRGGIAANLKNLQQGFIECTATLDELQTEQGKLITLDSSITALEAKQDELHSQFQKASYSENRQSLLKSAKASALEAETIFNEYIAVRNQLSEIIDEYAGKMLDKLDVFQQKKRDYKLLTQKLEPELGDYILHAQHSHRRQALNKSVAEEIKALGVSDETLIRITEDILIPPFVKFGGTIAGAEMVITQERQRETASGRYSF